MKIELKNIKYSDFASEETNCYEATIYIDGKKMGTVNNGGKGGCDNIYPYEVETMINRYAKTLPVRKLGFIDPQTGKEFECPQSAETIFGDLMDDYLCGKDLKKALKTKILFMRDKQVWETKRMDAIVFKATLAKGNDELMKNLKAEVILNFLPMDKALQLYKEGSRP